MRASEFKKLIREEVKGALSEVSSLETKVADLYGYANIKTQYSDDMVQRYGQRTIDLAIQMAPKIIAYEAELKKIVQEMEKSPEAKMLLKSMEASRAYDGASYYRSTLGDLINRFTKRR
jgi:hypothetical protein